MRRLTFQNILLVGQVSFLSIAINFCWSNTLRLAGQSWSPALCEVSLSSLDISTFWTIGADWSPLWIVGSLAPRSLATTWTRAGVGNCNYSSSPATPAPPHSSPAAPRRAPASASNHQQSPPSQPQPLLQHHQSHHGNHSHHSHKQKMYWKPWPSFFILPRNGMKFSTLLHAIQKKSETSQKLYGLHCCLQNFISILRNWKGQKCGI